jgi:hypothetical protein
MLDTMNSRGGGVVVRRQRGWVGLLLLLVTALMLTLGAPSVQAAPKPKPPRVTSISLVPTVTSITVQNGGLVAAGTVTATIKGQTTTVPFTGVPVNLALDPDQTGAGACPILDLELGPIDLNLLGLRVQTSPICLRITAVEGGGLLGDLLCAVANLLNGGLSLDQILSGLSVVDPTGTVLIPGLTPTQVTSLLGGLTNLLNSALQQLYQAIVTSINVIDARGTCAILHLELGPLNLNLLGLVVELDNCANGPVTVDITGVTGPGNLLGNLLCELLGGGGINLGATLDQILRGIVGLLSN